MQSSVTVFMIIFSFFLPESARGEEPFSITPLASVMKKLNLKVKAGDDINNSGDILDPSLPHKKQDYLKAVKLYAKSCDGGDTEGCYNLGVMYLNGQGVKQSNSKARELFGKACDGGHIDGCKNYAIMNKKQ